MRTSVLKFGGSSVASATGISRVLDIVEKEAEGGRVILVASAISGCTDALLDGSAEALEPIKERHHAIVNRLFTGADKEAVRRETDSIFARIDAAPKEEKVTFGEILSTRILAKKLEAEGYSTLWLDSRQLVVSGNQEESFRRIAKAVAEAPGVQIFVAPGFVCQDAAGRVSTLGRGGSDYSAAIYAAAVKADALRIWTDVPGIMTANPRQVPQARTIPVMTYKEAFTMAERGAKVLYAPTVAPAMEAGIDIEIRNTFDPDGGYTVIGRESAGGRVGLASAKEGDNVKISLVGTIEEGDRLLSARALEKAGVSALGMESSVDVLTVTVRPEVEEKALQALHRTFFKSASSREIHVFIAGEGAVGTALFELLQREDVAERTGRRTVIAGTANSRSFRMDLSGVKADTPRREGDFVREVCRCAPEGSVFVDATGSETIHGDYLKLLSSGISVVSSNRRALAVPYSEYAAMHAAARERGLAFRYGTTVGAALPILESITRSSGSGDTIVSLQAVVSCTLNQILGEYNPSGGSFAACLERAWKQGLTEPDPRLDLGGADALRKLLILGRRAGVPLEKEDVAITPIVPGNLLEGDSAPQEFCKALEGAEPDIAAMVTDAASQGKRIRFVASLELNSEGGYDAAIGPVAVPPSHPAYYIGGTENAIIFRTRLKPNPLVIQGPGEGPLQAASALLDDILR